MSTGEWILCPFCGGKTRLKARMDTVLIRCPLYCPKCRRETLVNVKHLQIILLKEPDAKTQSQ